MNIDKLSKRLECVASYITKGMRIADIGSDHAYLPCYAVKRGVATTAIAGEVAEGPYQSARQQVAVSDLNGLIEVRKGNGLAVIEPGEVDCVIIAGMGGALISEILESGKDKLSHVTRLILQPNIAAANVREWLLDNRWQLVNEQLIEEDGKIYEILVAERGDANHPYCDMKKELLLGPFLLRNKNEIFQKKWQQELDQWEKILVELEKAEKNPKTIEKQGELNEKIQIVRGVLE
ncbi:tRNA (adenine(22)-N(1))-methyltransferase [Lederbergia citrea]|uniref:tRNA (adenine(22)-N(1))-methyltransferase n=1 Tax=Lederbergia citrea TaxID=2833581 RepID=UPI001BCA5B51|nr:tRNA (adenine(22)-N(1))-methyltransferase TrmK [Lederbergia citrea]MBS4202872.1 tRNA (adenine-N(1))-methyltransferase [Lederbergia citrea]